MSGTHILLPTKLVGIEGNTYDGEVATFADLPAADQATGETYLVETTTNRLNPFTTTKFAGLYYSTGAEWVPPGPSISEIKQSVNFDKGWVQFSDAAPLVRTITANIRTKLSFGVAPSVLNTNGPDGAASLWNQAGGKFQPDKSGDFYIIRPSFTVDPTLNNRNLTLELDIGGAQGVIWSRTIRLARGAGVDTQITETIAAYTLGTFVANGGELYITCDGDINYTDLLILFERTFRA